MGRKPLYPHYKNNNNIMAHKKEFISTGGGFSVLNDGVKTEVIAQDGTIKGEIKEALAQGSIYIGDSSGITSELSVKTDGGILIGNGTTAAVKTLSGDVTMTNAGVTSIGAKKVVTASINDGAVTSTQLGEAAVTASKLSYEVVEVTVEAEENAGTAPVTAGSIILGYYPISNQDQFVDSIAVSETTLTITLAEAATADNVFNVVLLKA
ncbi:MAG: hypothetical protein ACOX4Q_15360 [Syntrophomonadales bacterium]